MDNIRTLKTKTVEETGQYRILRSLHGSNCRKGKLKTNWEMWVISKYISSSNGRVANSWIKTSGSLKELFWIWRKKMLDEKAQRNISLFLLWHTYTLLIDQSLFMLACCTDKTNVVWSQKAKYKNEDNKWRQIQNTRKYEIAVISMSSCMIYTPIDDIHLPRCFLCFFLDKCNSKGRRVKGCFFCGHLGRPGARQRKKVQKCLSENVVWVRIVVLTAGESSFDQMDQIGINCKVKIRNVHLQ